MDDQKEQSQRSISEFKFEPQKTKNEEAAFARLSMDNSLADDFNTNASKTFF